MKACPVCHARAFDDAEVCYGCMHRYEDGVVSRPLDQAKALAQPHAGRHASASPAEGLGDLVQVGAWEEHPYKQGMEVQEQEFKEERTTGQNSGHLAEGVVFDGAGWVVRFDLPGYESHAVRLPTRDGSCVARASEGSSSLLVSSGLAQSLPLTISICPPLSERDRGARAPSRGSSAKASSSAKREAAGQAVRG